MVEEIIEDFSALNYLIDFYFQKYKLAIEIDELSHADRDSVKENKRQKELKEHLKCTFISINPDKKDFSAYDGLIDDLSKRLLELEFKIKSLNKIKLFAMDC